MTVETSYDYSGEYFFVHMSKFPNIFTEYHKFQENINTFHKYICCKIRQLSYSTEDVYKGCILLDVFKFHRQKKTLYFVRRQNDHTNVA